MKKIIDSEMNFLDIENCRIFLKVSWLSILEISCFDNSFFLLLLIIQYPKTGTKKIETNQDTNNEIPVTAKIANVYSPTSEFASPIGKKPSAVINVPVNIGIAVVA